MDAGHAPGPYRNYKTEDKKLEKGFKAVSLPIPLFEELRKLADASDRSVAKQIEHYMRIGMSLETALPSADVDKVKTKKKSFFEVISDMVENGGPPKHIVERLKRENPRRIHFDPSDIKVAYQIDDTADTITKGRLTESGDFIPEDCVHVQHHSV